MSKILLFLLITTTLGIVIYLYLRQEQNKIASQDDKYKEAQKDIYKKPPDSTKIVFFYIL